MWKGSPVALSRDVRRGRALLRKMKLGVERLPMADCAASRADAALHAANAVTRDFRRRGNDPTRIDVRPCRRLDAIPRQVQLGLRVDF